MPDTLIAPSLMFTYDDLRQYSIVFNERQDCAVIAACIVTGEAYPKIHNLFSKYGRRNRCYTSWLSLTSVLLHCGYQLQDITKFYEGSSLRTIIPQLPDKGNFLVGTRKHVSAYRDGVFEDHPNGRKIYTQHVFQVVPLGDPPQLTPPPKPRRRVVIDYTRPTKAVHTIADIFLQDLYASHPDHLHHPSSLISSLPQYNPSSNPSSNRYWSVFRANVIAECVANGINKSTAAVQVSKWINSKGFSYLG